MASLGPLVAYLPTPRSDKGSLQVPILQELAHNALSAGANSLAVLGSVGAASYMPRSMRKRVIAAVTEVISGKVPLIAGVGGLTTAEVQTNVAEAHAAGATVALLAPVSYEPLTSPEVMGLYQEITELEILPVCVYHAPSTTKYRFTPAELGHLAQLPGIIGFKDTAASPSLIKSRLVTSSQGLSADEKSNIDWGFSGDRYGAAILSAGADSWHSGLAGVLPGPFVQLANLAVQTENLQAQQDANSLSQILTPITVVASNYGTLRVAHTIAELTGHLIGPLPRPLQQVSPEIRNLIAASMRELERELSAHQTPTTGRRAQHYVPRRAASGQ